MGAQFRYRAVLGVSRLQILPLLERTQTMHDKMAADPVTYAAPNPPLSTFLTLNQNVRQAQLVVPSRAIGAAAARDAQRDLLFTAAETERMYVQTLVDAAPGRAVTLIENAGLVVARLPVRQKPLLSLANGPQPGTVLCDANVGLLLATAGFTGRRLRCIHWAFSIDGGKSFVSAPSTPNGRTTLVGLPSVTIVGVKVSVSNSKGPGPWSQVVTILVH